MAFPVVSFTPTDEIIGHTSILQLVTPGGAPVTTNIKVKVVDYDGPNELLRKTFPDDDGVKRTRAVKRSAQQEFFYIETREFKKIVTLQAGKMGQVIEYASAQLWIRDYDDAAAKTAIKTDAFPCVAYREQGRNRFAAEGGDDAGTPVVLVIESIKNGDVVLTKDADA